MVLEIFNSCLSNQLVYNPNLVYTLLYKKHIFEPFRTNTAFQDIIHNIDLIIKYYSDLLDRINQSHDLDVQEVLKTIENGAKYWPKDKLRVCIISYSLEFTREKKIFVSYFAKKIFYF